MASMMVESDEKLAKKGQEVFYTISEELNRFQRQTYGKSWLTEVAMPLVSI